MLIEVRREINWKIREEKGENGMMVIEVELNGENLRVYLGMYVNEDLESWKM